MGKGGEEGHEVRSREEKGSGLKETVRGTGQSERKGG